MRAPDVRREGLPEVAVGALALLRGVLTLALALGLLVLLVVTKFVFRSIAKSHENHAKIKEMCSKIKQIWKLEN